jgi:hypothetical protein
LASTAATPIRTYANGKRLRWHMMRRPDGSSMWWWQDVASGEEFAVSYDSDATMQTELARHSEESAYRFVLTQD